jgi:hypothetical protein
MKKVDYTMCLIGFLVDNIDYYSGKLLTLNWLVIIARENHLTSPKLSNKTLLFN